MTPQAEAFLAALKALCAEHQREFFLVRTWPDMVFGIGALVDPAQPLRWIFWEEDAAPPEAEVR